MQYRKRFRAGMVAPWVILAVMLLTSTQETAAGQIIPNSLETRDAWYAVPFPIAPSASSVQVLDPRSGFTIDDARDPRSAGIGPLRDAAMTFDLSSVTAQSDLTLRVYLFDVHLTPRTDGGGYLPLVIALYAANGAVSPDDFPAVPSSWGGTLVPVGNYENVLYDVDVDASGFVNSLLAAGDRYLGVYLHTYTPGAALGEVDFAFRGAVLGSPLATIPEPPSIVLGAIACLCLASIRARRGARNG
jgi:hypothetical protein